MLALALTGCAGTENLWDKAEGVDTACLERIEATQNLIRENGVDDAENYKVPGFPFSENQPIPFRRCSKRQYCNDIETNA